MRAAGWKIYVSIVALVAAGMAASPLAQARSLEGPVTIRVAPLSRHDAFAPRARARLYDQDGLRLTDGAVRVAPFTLRAVIGADTVEVSVPEMRVEQLVWVADPIGCVDEDPKTVCHPTWGAEYSGQTAVNVPVQVEYANGGIAYSDYGIVSLLLTVTVVDSRVHGIEGAVQITYGTDTGLPNYRIPVIGRLK